MLSRRWVQAAVLIAVVIVIAAPTLTYPLGRDQGEFATIGRGLLHGRAPYADLWNPKPPAVFVVYAAAMALFGQTAAALRLIDLLILPICLAAVYWIGWRAASHRAGLLAALTFGLFYFTETFWTLTQNDGIALLPMTLAVVCAVRAAESPRRSAGWAFVAGILCALTIWFKYPFALFVGAVALIYGLIRRDLTRRPLLIDGAAFAAGGLLIGGGGALWLLSLGAWDALIESARVTSAYTALGFNPPDFSAAMTTAVGFRWAHWGLLFALLPFALILAIRRQGRLTGPLWAGIWVWLIAGLAIMLVQAKGYDYHWLPMLPPLSLLAAGTLSAALDRLPPRRALIAARMTGAALLLILAAGIWPRVWPYLTGAQDQAAYYAGFVAGEFQADESLAVTDFLRARVVPGDSLYIWGFRPEIYYLSGLNPATRFIFQFPLVGAWYPPQWRAENVEVLWAALPPYVLVLQVDYMPWVTGSDADSNTLLQRYTELNNWLIFNYERDTQIGNFFIWRRIPG
ncbi:MAG: hypothetical protein GYB67_17945 [Chloroflexi bacterium]|nr:hypothetical protein [Chloroflexota bacterium]